MDYVHLCPMFGIKRKMFKRKEILPVKPFNCLHMLASGSHLDPLARFRSPGVSAKRCAATHWQARDLSPSLKEWHGRDSKMPLKTSTSSCSALDWSIFELRSQLPDPLYTSHHETDPMDSIESASLAWGQQKPMWCTPVVSSCNVLQIVNPLPRAASLSTHAKDSAFLQFHSRTPSNARPRAAPKNQSFTSKALGGGFLEPGGAQIKAQFIDLWFPLMMTYDLYWFMMIFDLIYYLWWFDMICHNLWSIQI